MKSMSRPGLDKPAEHLTRESKFRVRVPIGAIFTTIVNGLPLSILINILVVKSFS